MKINLKADRQTIVVGSSLGLVLLLVCYLTLQMWFLRQDFADQIEAIQPRTARLLGILDSIDQLDLASDTAQNTLGELVYSVDQDSAKAASYMQQQVRELLTSAGLTVSGSQILPRREVSGFDRLSLDITAEGDIDALDEALSGLEVMRPLVFVESLKVQPKRTRSRRRRGRSPPEVADVSDPRKLGVRFQLFSLRLKD